MFSELSIIYLEDEPLVALDTGEHLHALGFKDVKVVSRLKQAETLVAENDFDVALLDINVDRGQTSLALGDKLADQGTKVVYASGNSEAGKSLVQREQWFLDKPFTLNQLSQKLEAVVSAEPADI